MSQLNWSTSKQVLTGNCALIDERNTSFFFISWNNLEARFRIPGVNRSGDQGSGSFLSIAWGLGLGSWVLGLGSWGAWAVDWIRNIIIKF